jgi:hypothetical protein
MKKKAGTEPFGKAWPLEVQGRSHRLCHSVLSAAICQRLRPCFALCGRLVLEASNG